LRQDVAHVAPVPTATARCRSTARVERVIEGVLFFRWLRRRFTALRPISFRRHRRMHDSNRTAAHRAVEVSRLLPRVWRLVVPRTVLCLLPNHQRDPFCRQQPACCPAIGKSRGYGRKWSLTRPAHRESCLPAPPRCERHSFTSCTLALRSSCMGLTPSAQRVRHDMPSTKLIEGDRPRQ